MHAYAHNSTHFHAYTSQDLITLLAPDVEAAGPCSLIPPDGVWTVWTALRVTVSASLWTFLVKSAAGHCRESSQEIHRQSKRELNTPPPPPQPNRHAEVAYETFSLGVGVEGQEVA